MYDVLNLREGRVVSYWVAYLMLVCLAGFRYKVGGDTYYYIYMHEFLPDLNNIFTEEVYFAKLQPLWLIFSAVAKSIGEDFYILQILHAIFVNTIIFNFIRRNTRYHHTGILLYFITLFPVFNFEILREAMAICCFIISLEYFYNKRWIKYYLMATIAFLFHFSAILLYLIPFAKLLQLRAFGLIIIFAAAVLFNSLVINIVNLPIIGNLIGSILIGYEDYNYTFFGLISIFIIFLLVPLFLTWVTQEKLGLKSKYGGMAKSGLIVGACIPLFFIFFRFFNYFSIFYMLMAVEAIHGISNLKKIRNIKIIILPLLFFLVVIFHTGRYFQDTSHIVSSTRWYNWWYPYYSIFDPETSPLRDQMIENKNRDNYERNQKY
jgi:hypothetical protein